MAVEIKAFENDRQQGRGPPTEAALAGGAAVKWVILVFFFFGMISSRQWHEAATPDRKMAFGLLAIAAFALVLVLGNTML
jgi:hypothetical protein